MKKIVLYLVTILLALSLIFSLSACKLLDLGRSSSSEHDFSLSDTLSMPPIHKTEPPTEAPTEPPTEPPTEKSAEDKINEYIESEELQKELEELNSTYESVYKIELRAEGEKLIYEFTLVEKIDDSIVDNMKDELESYMETFDSTFQLIANMMKIDLDLENPSVVINYNNADGTLIASFEYEAE